MSTPRKFAIVLVPQENGTFAAQVPALPEVNSQGGTRDEALQRVEEAIELAIEQRMADGELIPSADGVTLEHVTIEAA